MSKIAEKKALEAYPVCDDMDEFNRIYERKVYIKGYDQAMQDFMEKACEWLEDTQLENFICRDDGIYFDNEKLIEQFKNYMQNEM
jgi:hypothetical protein